MSIYKNMKELELRNKLSFAYVPIVKYEEGVRAIERNEIIKRLLKTGCVSVKTLEDVLDIPHKPECTCKCGGDHNGIDDNFE